MTIPLCSSSEKRVNPYATVQPRTRKKSQFIIILMLIASIVIIFYWKDDTSNNFKQEDEQRQQRHQSHHRHHPKESHPLPGDESQRHKSEQNLASQKQTQKSSFVPTLRGKKVFFEVVTVGLKQFSYLEDIIDSVRDLCEAGAHVSFHITSSNCNPHPGPSDHECVIRNQSSEETKEDNFKVETISHLNERVKCRNPEGSLDVSIHLISPDWG